MTTSLNARQKRFLAEYLKSGNKTQAAIAAGYSERNAESIGCRLSRNVKIRSAIESKHAELAVSDEMDIRWVRQNTKEIIEKTKDEQPAVALMGLRQVGRWNNMEQDQRPGDVAQIFQINMYLGD